MAETHTQATVEAVAVPIGGVPDRIKIELGGVGEMQVLTVDLTYKGEIMAYLNVSRWDTGFLMGLYGPEGGSKGHATFGKRRVAKVDARTKGED